jgi:hypothetical protein
MVVLFSPIPGMSALNFPEPNTARQVDVIDSESICLTGILEASFCILLAIIQVVKETQNLVA